MAPSAPSPPGSAGSITVTLAAFDIVVDPTESVVVEVDVKLDEVAMSSIVVLLIPSSVSTVDAGSNEIVLFVGTGALELVELVLPLADDPAVDSAFEIGGGRVRVIGVGTGVGDSVAIDLGVTGGGVVGGRVGSGVGNGVGKGVGDGVGQ